LDWGLCYRTGTKYGGPALLLAYVDDIVVAAQLNAETDEVMERLRRRWKITELGAVSTILGMKVRRERQARKVWLTQPAYIERVVEQFPGHRPRVTPLPLDRGRPRPGSRSRHRLHLHPSKRLSGACSGLQGAPDQTSALQMALGVLAYLSSTRT
jgi:hypothetical protein